mgnify:CR=1 FL=1
MSTSSMVGAQRISIHEISAHVYMRETPRLLRKIACNSMICDCYILTIIDGASTNEFWAWRASEQANIDGDEWLRNK